MGTLKSYGWNLWHGCHKYSAGCLNCYVYRSDERHNLDASIVHKTKTFDLPIQKKKDGTYKIPSGSLVYTCFSSDFLVKDADAWRSDAWLMMKERQDLKFLFLTKRIERFLECIPSDWEDGYDNVAIGCTVENQEAATIRLPIFNEMPIKHKIIICEPLLEELDLTPYLKTTFEQIVVGGESGTKARLCRYDWVLKLKQQADVFKIPFYFKQTGAHFEKDGKVYIIKRMYQHCQAAKAGLTNCELR